MHIERVHTAFFAQPHPVLFTSLDGTAIRRAALHTGGAAGLSGMDADGWRRMCTVFGDAPEGLCDALACSARRMATSYINPAVFAAFITCRLIPLDKKLGVRPKGISETVHRIFGKLILGVTGDSIHEATGSLQLCSRQECGIKAAIHAMHVDAVLLVDATNAFNRLNGEACMRNVTHLCPAITPAIINFYRHSAHLFVGMTASCRVKALHRATPLPRRCMRWGYSLSCEVWPHRVRASAGMRMMPQQAASSPRCASGGTDSSRMGQRTPTSPTAASPSLLSQTDRRQPRPCSVLLE